MVISVAGASTWSSICSQWGIENICFIAILNLYPQECSILPIFTSRFETDPRITHLSSKQACIQYFITTNQTAVYQITHPHRYQN